MNISINVNGTAVNGATKPPRYENTDIIISPIVTFKKSRSERLITLVASVNISKTPITKYSGFRGLPIKKWPKYSFIPDSLTEE